MSYRTVNPSSANELLTGDEGWIYVDVRTVEEFDEGHTPGAYNVPIAFLTAAGMEPNPRFVEVMKRIFPSDARLVLG